MTYAKDLGLTWGLYLHGKSISVGVAGWTDRYAKLCDDQRTVGGINRRSFPFKYTEQPNVVDRFAFDLSYASIQQQADIDQLQYVRATGGNLDVCQYKRTTEVWRRDASFTVVKTMRRLALRTISPLPTGVAAALPEIAISGGPSGTVLTEGSGAGKYVVGTADAYGRTTITLGTATTQFQLSYVPLLYMFDATISTAIVDRLSEDWLMTLVEAV